MKKIIVFFILLVITSATFSQHIDSSLTLVKQDYLQKSKRQKTAAWILLSGGFVLTATGLVMGMAEATSEVVYAFATIGSSVVDEPKSSNTSGILFFTGLASMVGSIPLFTASSRNKKTAGLIATSIKFEEGSLLRQSALTNIQFPAIAVKIIL